MRTLVRRLRLAPQITVDRFKRMTPGLAWQDLVETAILYVTAHYADQFTLHPQFADSQDFKDWCAACEESGSDISHDFGTVRLDRDIAAKFDAWCCSCFRHHFSMQMALFAYLRDVEHLYPAPEPEPGPSRYVVWFERRVWRAMDKLGAIPMDDRPTVGDLCEAMDRIKDGMREHASIAVEERRRRRGEQAQ